MQFKRLFFVATVATAAALLAGTTAADADTPWDLAATDYPWGLATAEDTPWDSPSAEDTPWDSPSAEDTPWD